MSRERASPIRWAAFCLALVLPAGPLSADDDAGGIGATSGRSVRNMTVDELLQLHHSETERVRMVVLEASVTDRKGRVIVGLGQRDFRVFENREPQDITFFSAEGDEPISVAFLLDLSGSMGKLDRLGRAKRAIRSLLAGLRPKDRFALICFADERVSWASDFTQDRRRFLRRLDELQPRGRTAMIDALAAAPGLVSGRVASRKAIVLITDGTDNASRTPILETVELARRVNVPVYTIAFLSVHRDWLPSGALEARIGPLEAVSSVTGGRVFPVYGEEELSAALDSLDAELNTQYVIGYYPEEVSQAGFQEIRLEVARRGLRVRTRSGYYAHP